jgi:glycosyltransferase involved in cell wall biosynthesis
MRIAFNAALLTAPTLRGWNRYTINLLSELEKLGIQIFLYAPGAIHPKQLDRLGSGNYHINTKAPRMSYSVWEQFWIPQACRKDQINVFHSPFNYGLPFLAPCPTVLTLHDAIDSIYYGPRTPLRKKLNWPSLKTRALNWLARAGAKHIITVSKSSRDDLISHFGLSPEKISVIYEAADSCFHMGASWSEKEEVKKKYHLSRPYVFYVGGWEERKNLPFLIRAFAASNVKNVDLVLAGSKDQDLVSSFSGLAESLGISSQLRLVDWINDHDLPALYANALCFAYPSQYEGFGLQLCEAMAAGCPTLAAQKSSLPEVLGEGGMTFSLDNPSELGKLIYQLSEKADFREELRLKALKRARDFSWQKAASDTLRIYQKICRAS